jgi:hypothetical protein
MGVLFAINSRLRALALTAAVALSMAPALSAQEGDIEEVASTESETFLSADTETVSIPSLLITSNNRRHPTMSGGWGPHLRSLLRTNAGDLWIAIDRATSVYTNTALDYYRLKNGAWVKEVSQAQIGGIQQNVATILERGKIIRSYGISKTTGWLEDCHLNTEDVRQRGCNAVWVSGTPLVLSAQSNYVGAAISPDGGTRLVWWSNVGLNGAGGSFSYIYNSGAGWNGPVTQHLSGYNYIGYISGRMLDSTTFVGTGELYVGSYPNGSYAATALGFRLGRGHTLGILHRPAGSDAGKRAVSVGDTIIDPATNSLHIIARTQDRGLSYYFARISRTTGGFVFPKLEPAHYFPGANRAKFHLNADAFSLLIASNAYNKIFIGSVPADHIDRSTDWSKSEAIVTTVPHEGFGNASALYVEDSQHQSTPVLGLNFAAVGKLKDADQHIYHLRVD